MTSAVAAGGVRAHPGRLESSGWKVKVGNPAAGGNMAAGSQLADAAAFDVSVAGAARVEIKVTILDQEREKAIQALGLDLARAEARSIFFFDSPRLGLFNAGVILRARQIDGKPDDSTVKIRPVDPKTLDPQWLAADGFKLEADAAGDKVVRSASLTAVQGKDEIQQVFLRKRKINKLYTPKQEQFLAAFHPAAIALDDLAVMGPIPVLRESVKHPSMTYGITAESWRLPDGTELLELSIKCQCQEAGVARKIFEGFLVGLGLDPHGAQETKTRRALMCFVSRLQAG